MSISFPFNTIININILCWWKHEGNLANLNGSPPVMVVLVMVDGLCVRGMEWPSTSSDYVSDTALFQPWM